ncbi:MAG: hypothetical protein Q9217_005339, partial [Psora testacea]
MGVLTLLTAVGSNVFVFLGLTIDDIKIHIGELKDKRPQLGDLQIPGRPKKPWHADDKVDAPLDPVDNHPIATLMQAADKTFQKYEDERSKSFRETVRNYRRRYERHPPPGFKEWYKYARKRNVHNIDDFEQIMDDIRPFWAVEPKILRNLAANMWRDADQGVSGIHIRKHKIVKETNDGWRSNALVSLIKKFVKYLPDMDIPMNSLDQPRVVVPWQDMQALLEKESEIRRTVPETIDEFTAGMTGLLNVKAVDDIGEKEDPGWYPAHGKQYMDIAKTACPPESLASENGMTVAEAENTYKDRLGGLVTNFNRSTDLCTVGPQLADKHGLLFSSSTMIATKRLVPIFGECKVSVNSDILFPANMYWLNDKRYDYDGTFDIDWEDKKDIMLWRGVTSGGTQTTENWREMHRQRLVMQVNSTEMVGKEVRILTEQPEKKGEYENYRGFHPSTFAAQHTDVGFTEAWGCVPNCSFYNDVWTLKEEVTLAEQFKNKFLVDVDGHSFSGRWHAFLESKALGIKATIFREWHDSRLFAWRHFVPMDNRYDDIYSLLTYFLGLGVPPEKRNIAGLSENSKAYVARHDTEGKRIADQGREWAKQVLRREDIEIYMFRLLLEYGRITDDNRDRIGYSGDGSELDKYDAARVWPDYRRRRRPHWLFWGCNLMQGKSHYNLRKCTYTIDLQDPEAPSAKDHTRQPVRPGALGEGAPAPHQADALKHVELELSEQHGRSPRASQDLSGKELQLLHDEADSYGGHDANDNLLRNAVQHAAQDEAELGEDDDGLDDDMADKISSSPTIGDDGGSKILQLPWPSRVASLLSTSTPEKKATHSPGPPIDQFSSSPYAETPENFPLLFSSKEQEDTPSKDHHHKGGYTMDSMTKLSANEHKSESRDRLSPLISDRRDSCIEDQYEDAQKSYDEGPFDPDDFHHLLLPDDDPLLDNSCANAPLEEDHTPETTSPVSKSSWDEATVGKSDDDDTEDLSYSDDSRFVDSGWGGECLREVEDIDFEFVYALHTFVATVEGQANATKGDTMVLLDDSNSYWWLLSQTMLGDQDEDKRANPLNPLKKAMRRRNVKKVEFAGNSYVEPSDVEYSTDEEEEGNDSFTSHEQNGAEEQRQDQHIQDADPNASVTPLSTRDRAINGRDTEDPSIEAETRNGSDQASADDPARDSDEMLERNGTWLGNRGIISLLIRLDDGVTNKSRKGTVRNTDSFFKDDSVETRKINLTPSLLRDDSNGVVRLGTSESRELKTRASLESLEKDAPPEKTKDEKKKKEKRGMLGGMFKRKDKRSKGQDRDDDSEKTSIDAPRSPTPKESIESLSQERQAAPITPQSPRQTSKLHKQPPVKSSPKSTYSAQNQATLQRQPPTEKKDLVVSEPERAIPPVSDPNSSMRMVLPESQPILDDTPSISQSMASDSPRDEAVASDSPKERSGNVFSPFVSALRSAPSEPKPVKTKRSRERMRMDDFDSASSSSIEKGTEAPSTHESHEEPELDVISQSADQSLAVAEAAPHGPYPTSARPEHSSSTESLSEPPLQIPTPTQQERNTPHQPPPLITDTSSQSQEDSPRSP